MLSKRSRYYSLEEVVHPDRAGVLRTTSGVRPLPTLGGQFFHLVDANDRLDLLAYKYYRQSLHWWRICDANPGAPSPRHLLGKVPQETIVLPVQWSANAPPWNSLFRMLHELVGVEHVIKGGLTPEDRLLEPVVSVDESSALFTLDETLRTALDSAVNAQAITPALQVALASEGLVLAGPLRFTKPGAQRWQIEVLATGEYYVFSYSDSTDLITVYDTVLSHTWSLAVVYNTNTLTQVQLLAAVAALGFVVGELQVITRIGKRIVIPPRYTGV